MALPLPLFKTIKHIFRKITKLIRYFNSAHHMRHGVHVVLVARPQATRTRVSLMELQQAFQCFSISSVSQNPQAYPTRCPGLPTLASIVGQNIKFKKNLSCWFHHFLSKPSPWTISGVWVNLHQHMTYSNQLANSTNIVSFYLLV